MLRSLAVLSLVHPMRLWPKEDPSWLGIPTYLHIRPLRPLRLALARSCRSSQQLHQAVRGHQCRTKERCCPEPRKPPKLVLDAEGRHYATTQGHDARPHKQTEIVQRARSNAAHYQAALHCGQFWRATSTAAAISASSARSSV